MNYEVREDRSSDMLMCATEHRLGRLVAGWFLFTFSGPNDEETPFTNAIRIVTGRDRSTLEYFQTAKHETDGPAANG